MTQNRSHAVMAQRSLFNDDLDYFPTPPWATRALVEHVIHPCWSNYSCLEPACGEGHMTRALRDYFKQVDASDIHAYGHGDVADFCAEQRVGYDWIITNPPFRLAEEFIYCARKAAVVGVAMLVRTDFLESSGRYNRLFRPAPPNIVAIFSERVPMIRGRLDRKASSATSYCWMVWQKAIARESRTVWIPPCRKDLERDSDYEAAP